MGTPRVRGVHGHLLFDDCICICGLSFSAVWMPTDMVIDAAHGQLNREIIFLPVPICA